METLNSSWLHGKYIVQNHTVGININIPFFAIDGYRIEFYQQGDSAQDSIDEMFKEWNEGDKTVEDCISNFINRYL